jgi:diketogulonate reductase-like aldo/keto reductase
MAYSPLEQGRWRDSTALGTVAERHGATPAQVALAWTIRLDGVVTIPKASSLEHVRANAAAAALLLSAEDEAMLERAYPPPSRDVPLETL